MTLLPSMRTKEQVLADEKTLLAEIERLRKEFSDLLVAASNDEIAYRTEIALLLEEIAKHDGVVAAWKQRCTEADDEIESLRKALASSCDEQRQLYREEANLPCEAAVEAQVLKDEIERLRAEVERLRKERLAPLSVKDRYENSLIHAREALGDE